MALTPQQKLFCQQYALTGKAIEAYELFFVSKSRRSASAKACMLLKKPEIKKQVEDFRKEKQDSLDKALEEQAEKIKKGICSITELDFYHSQIIRGELLTPTIMPVRVFRNNYNEAGQLVSSGWDVELREVMVAPSVRDKQRSMDALYKRAGAYRQLAPAKEDDFEEKEAGESVEGDYIILSTGEKLQLPG